MQYDVGILVTQPSVEADPLHAFMKVRRSARQGQGKPRWRSMNRWGPKAGLPTRRQNADAFEAAFARYHAQDWDAAEAALNALNTRAPRPLYDIYLARIVHFRRAPPPADWDGVFV